MADRNRVYDRSEEQELLVKDKRTFVSVEDPQKGPHSSYKCQRNREGNPVVRDGWPDYVETGLYLAGYEYELIETCASCGSELPEGYDRTYCQACKAELRAGV